VAFVEIRNLTKVFGFAESPFDRRLGEVRAVDEVSLDIYEGETLGLVGESGSGKSTLGRLILRLIEPTSGTIFFDGVDLLAANGAELRRLRRDMQIVFQDPFGSLDPRYRVEGVIAEPLILHGKMMHESLGRDARRFLVGLGKAGLAQPLGRRIQVAPGLDQRTLAFHHARAGALAQLPD